MATWAIGDLQGCYDELMALLDAIQFCDNDRLWFAGDLVNRGPKSLECLRFVKSLGDRAITVLGNHDLHLLAVAHDKRPLSKDTLQSILTAPDREALLDWLAKQPLIYRDRTLDYTLVHAGIPPQWKIKQALRYAAEVEAMIQSPQAGAFYQHMYGNTPARWSKELSGFDRLRCITNYLTRIRFCDSRGTLELKTKTPANRPPRGFQPWYDVPERKAAGKRILFGHWAALEGRCSAGDCFSLDGGCVWGGRLIAMRLEDGVRVSVPSPGYD